MNHYRQGAVTECFARSTSTATTPSRVSHSGSSAMSAGPILSSCSTRCASASLLRVSSRAGFDANTSPRQSSMTVAPYVWYASATFTAHGYGEREESCKSHAAPMEVPVRRTDRGTRSKPMKMFGECVWLGFCVGSFFDGFEWLCVALECPVGHPGGSSLCVGGLVGLAALSSPRVEDWRWRHAE